jgi:hypothetical protein
MARPLLWPHGHPGHHFLNEHGTFERIDAIAARGGKIVTAEGELLAVTAESVVYSEATRHLYEEAEEIRYDSVGGLALAPRIERGWRTYNFEVEGLHTYIAGGIRVHNDSIQDYNDLAGLVTSGSIAANSAYDSLSKQFGPSAAEAAAWGVTLSADGQQGVPSSVASQVDEAEKQAEIAEAATDPQTAYAATQAAEVSMMDAYEAADRLAYEADTTADQNLAQGYAQQAQNGYGYIEGLPSSPTPPVDVACRRHRCCRPSRGCGAPRHFDSGPRSCRLVADLRFRPLDTGSAGGFRPGIL